MEPSVFRESPLSPSEIANYLRDELKRLRKRRQIVTSDSATSVTVAAAAAAGPRPRSPPASPGSPEPMVEGQQGHVYQEQQQQQRATSLMIANTGGVLATANLAITPPRPTATTAAASSSSAANKKTDRPVFTLKQMTMICEKMCQERTDQVREEYDRILQQKLSEQYDAFVKFIDHQIQQRFNQSQLPSYLS